jgi:hypothetical protein
MYIFLIKNQLQKVKIKIDKILNKKILSNINKLTLSIFHL